MSVAEAIKIVKVQGIEAIEADLLLRLDFINLFRRKSFCSLLDCIDGREGYKGSTPQIRVLHCLGQMA